MKKYVFKAIIFIFATVSLVVGLFAHAAPSSDSTNTTGISTFINTTPTIKHQFLNVRYTSTSTTNNVATPWNSYVGRTGVLTCPSNYPIFVGILERSATPPNNTYTGQYKSNYGSNYSTYISNNYKRSPFCYYSDSTIGFRCSDKRYLVQYVNNDALTLRCATNTFDFETKGTNADNITPGYTPENI